MPLTRRTEDHREFSMERVRLKYIENIKVRPQAEQSWASLQCLQDSLTPLLTERGVCTSLFLPPRDHLAFSLLDSDSTLACVTRQCCMVPAEEALPPAAQALNLP